MIAPPAGLARVPSAAGLLLVPPGGRAAGVIRYHERLAPVDTFGGWVGRTLAADPSFLAHAARPREIVETHEGEHAARVVIDGEVDGAPARRTIGAVLAEDFVALIDALALGARERREWDDVTRGLLEGVRLRLGPRPRRFAHAAPPGWHALATGLAVTYYPPDYPRHSAQIAVFPAEPAPGLELDAIVARMLADERARGRAFTPTAGARRVALDSGLTGRCESYAATLDGRAARRELCVLLAGPYAYVLRLDSFAPARWPEDRLAFDALVASARPAPVTRPAAAGAAELAHWVD